MGDVINISNHPAPQPAPTRSGDKGTPPQFPPLESLRELNRVERLIIERVDEAVMQLNIAFQNAKIMKRYSDVKAAAIMVHLGKAQLAAINATEALTGPPKESA